MKKLSFIVSIALMGLLMGMSSCNKNNPKNSFDYPLENLYGTWRITHLQQSNGEMFDITTPYAEETIPPIYATFNKDASYEVTNRSNITMVGEYKTQGKIITCYAVDKSELIKFEVLSLTKQDAELTLLMMAGEKKKSRIICKKQ